MALELTQPLKKYQERRPVRRADNLTTLMCQLFWNLWASTSWNPQGLSRPVMGSYRNRIGWCGRNVRLETSNGLLWTGYWTSGFNKIRHISWLANHT